MGRTSTVYLLHFEQPIGNTDSKTGYARHYTGSAADLPRRLARHQAGSDAKIMAAVRQAGIGWVLARTWPGGRDRERQIKAQGGAARHCPVCKGQPPIADPVGHAEASPALRPAPAAARSMARAAESVPLWETAVVRLDPAEAARFMAELEAVERAAWDAAKPGAPEYEARFAEACDLSRIRAAEVSAIERLAEARALAEAEAGLREPGGRDLDREAG